MTVRQQCDANKILVRPPGIDSNEERLIKRRMVQSAPHNVHISPNVTAKLLSKGVKSDHVTFLNDRLWLFARVQ